MNTDTPDNIVRMKDVLEQTGLARNSVYRMIRREKFPRSISLDDGTVGWRQSEISRWIESYHQEKDWQNAPPKKPKAQKKLKSIQDVNPNRRLKAPQVLELCGISDMTLRRWIEHRGFPEPFRIGRMRYWKLAEVYEWLGYPLSNSPLDSEPAAPYTLQSSISLRDISTADLLDELGRRAGVN